MPLPRHPPWPRLPPALLLAAFALAPPASAADGFTEIGVDAPDPVPHAARPSLLAQDDPIPPAPAEDAEWAAWWREWRGWTPFAIADTDGAPHRGADPARLGGAAMAQPPAPMLAVSDSVPLFLASTPGRSLAGTSTPTTSSSTGTTPTGTTPTGTTPTGTDQEEETITLVETAPDSLLVAPPPITPAAPVIGEPASMALLGGALAALGLLRRRRPPAPAG